MASINGTQGTQGHVPAVVPLPTCGPCPCKRHRPALARRLHLPGTSELRVEMLQLRGCAAAEGGVRRPRRLSRCAAAEVAHGRSWSHHRVEDRLDKARGQAGEAAGEGCADHPAGRSKRGVLYRGRCSKLERCEKMHKLVCTRKTWQDKRPRAVH